MGDANRIAGNKRVDAMIDYCFGFLSERDANAFRRKFKTQPHDGPQIMHTFRELLLGAFLSSYGLTVQCERKIDGKTPDWCVLESGDPATIVELGNLDPPHDMSKYLLPSKCNQGVWSGWLPDSRPRLYQILWTKCRSYQEVAETHSLAYVPAVFPHFDIDVDLEEVNECMTNCDTGLFREYGHVSGVLYFCENAGYWFTYLRNPHATKPVDLPSGHFACA